MIKIWDRWKPEYFDKLVLKLYIRRDIYGNLLYKNKEDAFWDINDAYEKTYGKERYISYGSYQASKSRRLRKQKQLT